MLPTGTLQWIEWPFSLLATIMSRILAPQFRIHTQLCYGNKKDVGVCSSAPIPKFRPSHCPCTRISNASQPTPSNIILFGADLHHNTWLQQWKDLNIIHPRGRFSCITSVTRFKVAKFDYTDNNVRKRPFPSAVLTNGVLSLWIPTMFVLTRPALTVISHCWPPTAWTGLVGSIITKKTAEKSPF